MAEHVANFENTRRAVSLYLSNTTVNEFIKELADQVKAEIVQDVVNAKSYVSITVSVDIKLKRWQTL